MTLASAPGQKGALLGSGPDVVTACLLVLLHHVPPFPVLEACPQSVPDNRGARPSSGSAPHHSGRGMDARAPLVTSL